MSAAPAKTSGRVPPPLAKAVAGAAPVEPALSPDDPCDECEGERVELDWADCVIKPCKVCRPAEHIAFLERRAAMADDGPITLTSAEMVEGERAYDRAALPRYAGPSFTSDDPHRFDEDPGSAAQQKADAERARRVVEMLLGGK